MKSSPPPQPKQLSFYASIESDRLELKLPSSSRAIGCFMLVWLTGWSGGCGFILWRYLTEPELETLLFAVPFWVSWIFVACFTMGTLFGRERFRLDEHGAAYEKRMLLLRWARIAMPLEELIRFGTVDDETQSATGQSGVVVELRTIGRPIRFGSMLLKPERDWLRHTLNQKLQAWQRTTNRKPELPVEAKTIGFGRPLAGELLSDETKERNFRTAADLPLEPPSDSRWRLRDDFDSIRYSLRGRFSLGAIGGVLFINLFINGILAIFAKQVYWPDPSERLFGIEWLYRFLFLKPFELVGLVFVLLLLLVVLEPLRVWSWRIARDRIIWKLTWLGIGFRKTYRFDRIDRLEVRRITPKTERAPKVLRLANLWAPQGCMTYDVVCLSPEGKSLAEIEGLTLGEAGWMADSLIRKHPEWFG